MVDTKFITPNLLYKVFFAIAIGILIDVYSNCSNGFII